MQKFLLLTACFLFSLSSFAQDENYTIDIEVGYLRFKNDSIHFKTPKNISISTAGCTDIFSLGKTKQYEFGMKIEILKSALTGNETFLVGQVYYIKNSTNWQEVMKLDHRELTVRPINQRERTDMFIMGGASIDSPDLYDVRLNDNYYRNK